MRERNLNAEGLLGDYMNLLLEYFHIFGDKKCCANDLKLFLEFLEPLRRPGFASQLIRDSGISSTTLPQSVGFGLQVICSCTDFSFDFRKSNFRSIFAPCKFPEFVVLMLP
jgi:N-terminal acetyltransferase B complex non-catalytic subunit